MAMIHHDGQEEYPEMKKLEKVVCSDVDSIKTGRIA